MLPIKEKFLSFTNKVDESKKNIISSGVNSISQFNAIKKFQTLNKIERSYLFAPDTSILDEIKIGLKKSKIKLKDKILEWKLPNEHPAIYGIGKASNEIIDAIEKLE